MADKARVDALMKAAREGTQLTPEEMEEITGGPLRGARKLEAPIYYASTSMLLATGNDFTIIFSRPAAYFNGQRLCKPSRRSY